MKLGAEALRDGFASGLSGLVKQPKAGFRQGGVGGAIKGVGLGFAGSALSASMYDGACSSPPPRDA